MTQHTSPNEWNGSPAPEAPDTWWVDDVTGQYVNSDTGSRMTQEEARAVIAAPDLLAALEKILTEEELQYRAGGKQWSAAYAAIAKARGEG